MSRSNLSILRFALLFIFVIGALDVGLAQGASNPIVIENQQPGSANWRINNIGSDSVGQIKGYASAVSVNKGQSITFYVSVNPAQTYTLDIYRMGWYQGLGARLMQHIGPLNGTSQPTCPTDPTTGMIECHWAPAYTLATSTSWTDGIYLGVLTNSQNFQNYIVFCVRDDNRVAALLYQQPVTTYQAYNDYPQDSTTGKSLYSFNSYGANTVGGSTAAVKVSYDRPYAYDGTNAYWTNGFLDLDYAMLQWLEMSGYDVTYSTDLDTHLNPGHLLNFLGVLSVAHDEYWSKPMYDGFQAAIAAGVNVGFFGADEVGWQIRFEASSTGVANRVEVCYKNASIDPIYPTNPSLTTVDWSDNWQVPLNRPPQPMVGVQYLTQGQVSYVVQNSGNWVYAGTGFKDGDSVPSIVGYEADSVQSQYPTPNAVPGTYTVLSNSPFGFNVNGVPAYGNSTVYQATSGAWVFAAGCIYWDYALSDTGRGYHYVDSRIQQTTANVLNRFITPASHFVLSPSPASQTVTAGGGTSYTVTITPSGGFNGQVSLSASGWPAGAGGSFSPNPATGSSTLSVTTTASTPPGNYTITITGTSGALSNSTTVNLIVNAPPNFALGASPSSQTVTPGGGTTYTVTVTPSGGFNGQVSLSASGWPAGAGGSFSPNPATGSSTLTVTTSASTPPGNYTVTITGTSGTLSHSTTVSLVVVVPDFALSASPSSQSVQRGSGTSYNVTITRIGGFSGSVNLSVSGLPTGAAGTFNPNPATSSSILSVTTAASTPTGTYSLTITGSSLALNHTVTVSLIVSPPGVMFDNSVSSGFQWGVTRITTPAFTVGSGVNRAAMIMVAMSANNATGITASLGGVNATLIPGTDSGTTANLRTLIFQVINPPSGLQTATVSWTTSMSADVGVITVSGADQSTPCINGTFVASNSAPAAISLTIASNPGDLTSSVGTTSDAWVSPFTNQTLKWGLDQSDTGGDVGPGTGTTTHTWTEQFGGLQSSVSGANFKAGVSTPDFVLNVSPSSQAVPPGSGTSYTVNVTPLGGFAGSVNLSVSGLPTGAAGSFNPNPATSSSILSVTTATSTPTGTYSLTITGSSGALNHTATVSLIVSPPGVKFDNAVSTGFQWGVTRITTPVFTVGTGVNRAAMIMVAMSANNATGITASLGGVNATLIPGTDSGTSANLRTLIFQVINPPSGLQTATVSWTTSMSADVGVITVSGADQSTPCISGTFVASNSAPAAISLTITSNPGDLTSSVGTTSDAWVSPFTSQTLKWGIDQSTTGGDIGPGTGTTTHTWTEQFGGLQSSVSGANFKAH